MQYDRGHEHRATRRRDEPIRYVLFVCNHNAGRSQMAQAFFERYGPEDVRAESAGNEPAAEIWPTVIEAMGEIGIDLTGRKPKKLTVEMQLHADWAITMGCGDSCPYVPATVEDWDIPDPARQADRGGPSDPRRHPGACARVDRHATQRDTHRPDRARSASRDTRNDARWRVRQRQAPRRNTCLRGGCARQLSAARESAPTFSRSPTAKPATAYAARRAT